jgi:hypothetical protein
VARTPEGKRRLLEEWLAFEHFAIEVFEKEWDGS